MPAAGTTSVPKSSRTFLRQPLSPQDTEHSPKTQSFQTQYNVLDSLHSSHRATCLESWGSQALPRALPCWITERVLVFSPSQREQPPHLFHSPQRQSSGSTQGWALQGEISRRALSQAAPPFLGNVRILRWRQRSPPSQGMLHLDHSPQSAMSQSTGSCPAKPQVFMSAFAFAAMVSSPLFMSSSRSPASLQERTSWSGAVPSVSPHHLPAPLPGVAMERWRDWTPSHVCEHSLHPSHSVISQSTSPSQRSGLHERSSDESPKAGLPQAVASWAISRCRHCTPPPHVLEHSLHSNQLPHLPSTQVSQQGEVLQAMISLMLSNASQGLPPREGCLAMVRFRLLYPPPQLWEHSPHLDHWPHWQSSCSQGRSVSQGRASSSGSLQPRPPSKAGTRILRLRCWMPWPQSAEHLLHSPQEDREQSLLSGSTTQGKSLQGSVSAVESSHGEPPFFGWTSMWRCRCVCPPAHVRLHKVQGVHSLILQSSAPFVALLASATHGPTSLSGDWHGSPPKAPGLTTSRSLYLWRSFASQPDQSDHKPSTQSCGSPTSPHLNSLHGRVCCKMLALFSTPQSFPPRSAWVEIVRTRSCWPPPHL
mmetsp:Transcript_17776/g.50614  ORF Transcript_17776/g.50614 Transcript_17776/m.50614 type:complete len:592 (-) Transcript_17776:603-2378(-)